MLSLNHQGSPMAASEKESWFSSGRKGRNQAAWPAVALPHCWQDGSLASHWVQRNFPAPTSPIPTSCVHKSTVLLVGMQWSGWEEASHSSLSVEEAPWFLYSIFREVLASSLMEHPIFAPLHRPLHTAQKAWGCPTHSLPSYKCEHLTWLKTTSFNFSLPF